MKRVGIMFVSLLLLVSAANAYEIRGIELPDTVKVGDTQLILNGAGLRTFLMIKFYAGALYLPEKESNSRRILEANDPMALKIVWRTTGSLSRGQEVIREGFANTMLLYPYPDAKKESEQFVEMIVKPKKGDTWTLTYEPGVGSTFYLNDQNLGTIAGNDFKKILFGVWLADNAGYPGDPDLRDGMLGKED